MNYMKQIAQMLEVELDKEFNVTGNNGDALLVIKEDGIYRLFKSKWVKTKYFLDMLLTGKIEIIKKPILDDNEKEYLSGVIKPFRDKVKCIVKRDYEMSYENEYIFIVFNDDGCMQIKMCFPSFKKGTMYKGMELNKNYTLEELGL